MSNSETEKTTENVQPQPATIYRVEIIEKKKKEHKNEHRITARYMSKYERAKLLGTRATQISTNTGEPPTVDLIALRETTTNENKYTDCLAIATEELRQKTLPLNVRRYTSENLLEYEDWSVVELIWDDHGIWDDEKTL